MYKRYGMNVHVIKKVKTLVYSDKSDSEIMNILGLSFGQVDFVRNILCKKYNRYQDRRISALEKNVKKMYHSPNKDFGIGVLVESLDEKWSRIQFNGRKVPTLVNMKTMSFDLGDNIKGKVLEL